MDLSLTETQEMLKGVARNFLERECPRTRVRELDESETGFDRDLWRQIAQMGWTGMLVPEEYRGSGSNFTDLGVLYEEMGRALLPSPHFSTAVLGALALLEAGSPEQKARWLPAIAQGDLILALALTEPEYGWGPESVRLQATRRNGGFVLSGTKLFVQDAHIADQILCVARTRESENPARGITLFLVDRRSPGLSCRQVSGWTGAKLNEVTFESVAVPAENVLGDEDNGWAALAPVLDKATVVLCAYMVGGNQQVMEIALEYARNRVQFGSPIGSFQRVQDLVIEIVNGLDAARWTTYEALWKIDTGRPIATAASVAKTVASEAYRNGCVLASQVHGAAGLLKETGIYLYTKTARTLYHYLGDPAYHQRRLAQLLEL